VASWALPEPGRDTQPLLWATGPMTAQPTTAPNSMEAPAQQAHTDSQQGACVCERQPTMALRNQDSLAQDAHMVSQQGMCERISSDLCVCVCVCAWGGGASKGAEDRVHYGRLYMTPKL
jgi:hypothetical protein